MLKSIGIGAESFHELIESNSYYVDKTAFIRTVFKENTSKVMLITRPRRFGKTLTMSTFYDFLSLNHNHCHFYTYANKLGVTCCTKSFHWLKSKFIQ